MLKSRHTIDHNFFALFCTSSDMTAGKITRCLIQTSTGRNASLPRPHHIKNNVLWNRHRQYLLTWLRTEVLSWKKEEVEMTALSDSS